MAWRFEVASWGDGDVDDLAVLVDRPVDGAPAAGDLHVGLVDEPAIADRVPTGPGCACQTAVLLVTKARARQRLIRWFDRYNQTRRHSHCGWRAPITYEKININTARAA